MVASIGVSSNYLIFIQCSECQSLLAARGDNLHHLCMSVRKSHIQCSSKFCVSHTLIFLYQSDGLESIPNIIYLYADDSTLHSSAYSSYHPLATFEGYHTQMTYSLVWGTQTVLSVSLKRLSFSLSR